MIFSNQIFFFITWINLFSKEINNVEALYELNKGKTFLELPKTNLPISEKWMQKPLLDQRVKLGQVSGVCVDRDNYVYLFHRAERIWDLNSFSADNIFIDRSLGPIKNHTVFIVASNGTLVNAWGSEMFYLPHGITVDKGFNVWVTDVALHQVMKFSISSWTTPLLSVGVAFTPGSDSRHLCKPTSVAVTDNGDFFVADGYCNYRILKFNSGGDKILEWGRNTVNEDVSGFRIPSPGEFLIPHALTLADDLSAICVADRENGRVQCFNSMNGSFTFQLKSEYIGHRIFSVVYCKSQGLFYLINGYGQPFRNDIPVQGFIMTSKGDIVGRFGTHFKNPHDLALSTSCDTIYVSEIDPHIAWKLNKENNSSISKVSSPALSSRASTMHVPRGDVEGLAGAIMITGACLIFAASLLIAALVYSRSHRAGCGQCSSNKWLSNSSKEGFKLMNILGRQGFEKLNSTEESDEEQPLA